MGDPTVISLPQLSYTLGGAGAVSAAEAQGTVEVPFDGTVQVGGVIVYV